MSFSWLQASPPYESCNRMSINWNSEGETLEVEFGHMARLHKREKYKK